MATTLATGLARRDSDPLASVARAMLAHVSPVNRLHDSSVVTLVVDALRAQGSDPLDCGIEELDRVIPEGTRTRTRAWRPFARLLAAADDAGLLGPRGVALRARMAAGPTGRRVFVARWSHYTAALGVARGAAPVELREAFLRMLAADGVPAADIARTRDAIRRLERVSIARGERPERLPRHERLIRALIAAGARTEREALRLIDASHAGHRPSAWRWIDAVTARFLAWCEERRIAPFAATTEQVRAFRAERGDALGVRTVERLLAAARG